MIPLNSSPPQRAALPIIPEIVLSSITTNISQGIKVVYAIRLLRLVRVLRLLKARVWWGARGLITDRGRLIDLQCLHRLPSPNPGNRLPRPPQIVFGNDLFRNSLSRQLLNYVSAPVLYLCSLILAVLIIVNILACIMIFIAELALGLVYAWKKGALDWE